MINVDSSGSQGFFRKGCQICQEATNGHVHLKSLQIDIGIYIYITDRMGIERTYSVGILWKYIYTISIKQQFPGLWVYHQHSPTI